MRFATEQIWPPVSGHHLNPDLISNVKYTLSPFLAFLNKWPPDTERGREGGAEGCVYVFVCKRFVFDFHKPFLFLTASTQRGVWL